MTLRITAAIGAVLLIGFLGFLGGWLLAPPLIAIMVLVAVLLLYDIWQELRANRGDNGA